MERGQTEMRAFRGSDRIIDSRVLAEWFWESQPQRVKASYDNKVETGGIRSTAGHVKPCRKAGGPPPKAKYYPVTDREAVL